MSDGSSPAASSVALPVSGGVAGGAAAAAHIGQFLRFLAGKLAGAVVAVFGVVTIVFFALQLSGSPVSSLLGPDSTQADVERVEHLLGYDRPVVERYVAFLGDVVTLRFPSSLIYREPALEVVASRLGPTLKLAGTGMAVAIVLGLLAGYVMATSRLAWLRSLIANIMSVFQAVPTFVLAIALIYLFAVNLHWVPASGSRTTKHLILPALTLGLFLMSPIARMFRATLVSVAAQPHVEIARLKGLGPVRLRLRHVVPNAFAPVLTIIGLQTGSLIGGALIIESAFSWPGVGLLAARASAESDYPLILAIVVVVSLGYVLINLLVDVLYGMLDPAGRRR
jgi:peptide/nickel transport system permease protein